jgi:transposase
MEADQPIRKAPTFTVFRLYCIENLSLEQVRKKLQCSRGTITNRLRTIRQKTGTDPAALRAYSAQFTRIEQTLSDPRARRIASRNTAEEPDAEQE